MNHAYECVRERSKARGAAKAVLLAIALRAGDDGLGTFPSNATIAADTGLSESTVHRARRALLKLGELVVEEAGGGRRSNRYRVNVDLSPRHPRGTNVAPQGYQGGRRKPIESPSKASRGRASERSPNVLEAIALASRCPTITSPVGFVQHLVHAGDLDGWLERNRPAPPPKQPARPADVPVQPPPAAPRVRVPRERIRAIRAEVGV